MRDLSTVSGKIAVGRTPGHRRSSHDALTGRWQRKTRHEIGMGCPCCGRAIGWQVRSRTDWQLSWTQGEMHQLLSVGEEELKILSLFPSVGEPVIRQRIAHASRWRHSGWRRIAFFEQGPGPS
jgi:hypothetical protein